MSAPGCCKRDIKPVSANSGVDCPGTRMCACLLAPDRAPAAMLPTLHLQCAGAMLYSGRHGLSW